MHIDINELRLLDAKKLITLRTHPADPDLLIANYTPMVQFDKLWGEHPLLTHCRGLILNASGDILARPFPKFFNVGEVAFPEGTFSVSEKADGSLGILYWLDGLPYIATRGSFESDQAKLGTELLHTTYREAWPQLDKAHTYLFEVVSGQRNRIVINYKEEALILLTVINTETGAELETSPGIGFPIVRQHGRFTTLFEFINSLPPGSTRDDLGQRIRNEAGLAQLPGMQTSGATGVSQPSYTRESGGSQEERQGMGEGESKSGAPVSQEQVSGAERTDSLPQECAVLGLQPNISPLCDGLRPQAGRDEAIQHQREAGQSQLEGSSSRDSEVRRGVRELSPDTDIQRDTTDSVEEGFVLRWDDGTRLKLKTSEYLRLHKVLTGVSARTIWQAMKNGDNLQMWLDNVPDEFADFIRDTVRQLQSDFDRKAAACRRIYDRILAGFEGFAYPDRKQFAMEAVKHPAKDILFLMFDGKPWAHRIWDMIYPAADTPTFKKEM